MRSGKVLMGATLEKNEKECPSAPCYFEVVDPTFFTISPHLFICIVPLQCMHHACCFVFLLLSLFSFSQKRHFVWSVKSPSPDWVAPNATFVANWNSVVTWSYYFHNQRRVLNGYIVSFRIKGIIWFMHWLIFL